MGKYVGIDLGTTYSVIAYIDQNGNPVIIKNDQGESTTPSAVLFAKDEVLVGEIAKRKSTKNPQNYMAFAKRHMGERNFTFNTRDGMSYSPEKISAIILKKLKTEAEAFLGEPIDGAVITVPAYFTDSQRQSTKDAAKIAGIPVVDIINEPTAAAIAFGVSKEVDRKQKVLIYDFGGGTFDVSVLEIDADNIRVIGTGGHHRLGGCDIDNRLVELICEVALDDEDIDIASDEKAMQSLRLNVERCKKELSVSKSTEISLYVRGEEFETEIEREEFNEAIEDILDDSLSILQKTLTDINLSYSDLDKILLVEGTTRIPYVRKLIKNETGIEPSSEVNPDEAVAIGAAYRVIDVVKNQANAAPEETEQHTEKEAAIPPVSPETVNELPEGSKYNFTDVTSHAVGIVVWDSEQEREINSVILPKNTPIPASVSREYSTVAAFQNSIKLKITQGDNENLDYCTIVGDADVEIRPRENKVPIKIVIGFDANAIIHVRAIDMEDNINLGEIDIDRSGHNMTQEQVESALMQINDLDIG